MHADNQLLWIFATANLVVALAITVWVLRRQRAQGGHLRLAISVLAGGLISPLVCPLWTTSPTHSIDE
jgi:membrane glycosyltransferase